MRPTIGPPSATRVIDRRPDRVRRQPRPAGTGRAGPPARARPERTDAPRVPETGSRRRAEDIGETWPDLPEWATPDALDADARRDLRGLSKEDAAWVAAHLVAAGTLADDDPQTAWWHARAARARGGRIAVVRETVGLVAYRAGEWAEAIGELRAARRMGGGPGHLAVLADCERALGHPEKAIELARSEQAAELDDEAGSSWPPWSPGRAPTSARSRPASPISNSSAPNSSAHTHAWPTPTRICSTGPVAKRRH